MFDKIFSIWSVTKKRMKLLSVHVKSKGGPWHAVVVFMWYGPEPVGYQDAKFFPF